METIILASTILGAFEEARSQLIGRSVVLTDGKAGTAENVWLDELHGLRVSIKATMESGPVSTLNLRKARPFALHQMTQRSMQTFASARCFRAISHPLTASIPCMFVLGEDAMTFTIHASKNDQASVTVRINPATAVDKARVLELSGWQVYVTDSSGHLFTPLDFDRLSSFACETA